MSSERSSRNRAFLSCFLLAFLFAGIPWWLAPYDGFTWGSPWSLLGLLAFGGLAAWVVGQGTLSVAGTTLAAGAAVPAAVMARVLVDTFRDPTSHSLWPFEVVLAGMFGFAAAFAAALFGRLLRWLSESA